MASANLDILVSVGGLVYELESAANKNGATIYNICHRNAGWAIQWHEEKKQGDSDNWKDGLVIYRYYETLEAMVKGEFLRRGESLTQRAPDSLTAEAICPRCCMIFDVALPAKSG